MSRPALLLLAALALPVASRAAEPAVDPDDKARSWFTDTALLTQDGKEVRFYTDVLRGKVVALSFIFARCEGACPLLAAKLNRVRAKLGERFGKDVHFVSISVDPTHDGAAELAAFAQRHRAEHPGWTFLTGTPENVQHVLERLGSYTPVPENHSTGFVIGNVRTRHWAKVRPDAPAEAVALQLAQLADEDAPGKAAALPAGVR